MIKNIIRLLWCLTYLIYYIAHDHTSMRRAGQTGTTIKQYLDKMGDSLFND